MALSNAVLVRASQRVTQAAGRQANAEEIYLAQPIGSAERAKWLARAQQANEARREAVMLYDITRWS